MEPCTDIGLSDLPDDVLKLILAHEGMFTTLGSACNRFRTMALLNSPIHVRGCRGHSHTRVFADFMRLVSYATTLVLHAPPFPRCDAPRLLHLTISIDPDWKLAREPVAICSDVNIRAPSLKSIKWANYRPHMHQYFFDKRRRDDLHELMPRLSLVDLQLGGGAPEDRQPITLDTLVHAKHPLSVPRFWLVWDAVDDLKSLVIGQISRVPLTTPFSLGEVTLDCRLHVQGVDYSELIVSGVQDLITDPTFAARCSSLWLPPTAQRLRVRDFITVCLSTLRKVLVPFSFHMDMLEPGDLRTIKNDSRFAVGTRNHRGCKRCVVTFTPA